MGVLATIYCARAMRRSLLLALFFGVARLLTSAQDGTQPPPPNQPTPTAQTPPSTGTTQGPLKDATYPIGRDVRPPRAISAPDPPYSDEARRARLVGTVRMTLIVDTDGKPKDIKVTHRLGMGLDEQAVATVQNWRFQPAEKAGVPVSTGIMVEVYLRLDGVPATLDALSRWAVNPPQFLGVDTALYPLVLEVHFATGQQVAKGYVVKVETSIVEAGQKRDATLSCGPKGHCFLLGSGRYPARWLHDPDQLQLIGGMGKSPQKAQYSVAAPPAPIH